MAQITENMVLDMLTACERNEHPPLTVWEAKQLLHAWREREALRKDAERYRWLAGNGWTKSAIYATGPRDWGANGVALLAGPQLDDAIDGAMAEQQENALSRRSGIKPAKASTEPAGRGHAKQSAPHL